MTLVPDPKKVVRDGYDTISAAYRADDAPLGEYEPWLSAVRAMVPAGGSVLDIGCGNGVPAGRWLAGQGYEVLGIDLSATQIERARQLVPGARFAQVDMTEAAFDAGRFDAVIALYSIIHVPVEQQPAFFTRLARWVRPGGVLVATLGETAWTGTEDDWLGAPMYWSHADRDTYARWCSSNGFGTLATRFVPEGNGGHALMLACRDAALGQRQVLRLREAQSDDLAFLREMLWEAARPEPGESDPGMEARLAEPRVASYLTGWGSEGDVGVVAEVRGRPVGATWCRLPGAVHGWGYVADDIPEVAIAVAEERRGQGIGRALLSALIAVATLDGYPALSLSVLPTDPTAMALYVGAGFEQVGTTDGLSVMCLDLSSKKGQDGKNRSGGQAG